MFDNSCHKVITIAIIIMPGQASVLYSALRYVRSPIAERTFPTAERTFRSGEYNTNRGFTLINNSLCDKYWIA